jgi:hypothetical protein
MVEWLPIQLSLNCRNQNVNGCGDEMKIQDIKKLWSRAGNICSFPDCDTELVPERKLDRVIGEEAHIKGEKPTSPRYDPDQSPEERDSYDNYILLCPNHHVEIDGDKETWTVERLHQIKRNHERQIIKNRQFEAMLNDIGNVYQKYQSSDLFSDVSVAEIIVEPKAVKTIQVDASKEGGINTLIKVFPGQKISFFARGLISYDGGNNFATPEGIICNEYGLPKLLQDEKGNKVAVFWPHPNAYKTDGNEIGRIGSLIGWINGYTEGKSFFIGSKNEIEVTGEGYLYLSVNDAKGAYGDNDGEFRVDIKIMG